MNEVEEFLRRVAQRRQQQSRQDARPDQPATPPITAVPVSRLTPSSAPLVDAVIVGEDDAVSGADIVQNVRRHLDARSFDERASHLGEGARLSEQRLEREVEQRFQSEVTTKSIRTAADSVSAIAPMTPITGARGSTTDATTASQIVDMLRNSESLRNAILISEILNRPESRW